MFFSLFSDGSSFASLVLSHLIDSSFPFYKWMFFKANPQFAYVSDGQQQISLAGQNLYLQGFS